MHEDRELVAKINRLYNMCFVGNRETVICVITNEADCSGLEKARLKFNGNPESLCSQGRNSYRQGKGEGKRATPKNLN